MEILIFFGVLIFLNIAVWVEGVDSRDLFNDDQNTQSRPRRSI
ncbi:MAG TPA: hypothetical protein VGU71_09785 [Candidatus Dormibacteraeota bacterium]|nr:hypothetical protein [Candidatus Dormibacteraeota bacterium]